MKRSILFAALTVAALSAPTAFAQDPKPATDPKERQKLMQEHMQTMQTNLQMMRDMGGSMMDMMQMMMEQMTQHEQMMQPMPAK